MNAQKLEKLTKMANQIGDYFAAQPAEIAAEGAAAHFRQFWTPKMIREIVEQHEAGQARLNPTAAAAIDRLRRQAHF